MSEGFALYEVVHDSDGNPTDYVFLDVNPAFERLTGLRRNQVVGRALLQVLPGTEAVWTEAYTTVALTGHPARFESHCPDLGKHLESKVFRPTSGQLAAVFTDITERRKHQLELQRMNRTLHARAASDAALMRAADEQAFLDEVCRIVVDECGYAMVWIGMAEDGGARRVRPVASAGFEDGYLETLGITWADDELGRGPTGTAIRTGKWSRCRNMLTDPAFEPWRAEALSRGYASSLALPLSSDGKAFGALTVYSRHPESFPVDEVALLTDIADDLAYGITAIRMRRAHQQAEEQARRRAEELDAVFSAITDAVVVTDERGVPVKANPAACRDLGLDPVTTDPTEIADRIRVRDCQGRQVKGQDLLALLAASPGSARERRFVLVNAQGRAIPVLASAAPLATKGGTWGRVAVWHDLTRQEKTEHALRRALERAGRRSSEVSALLRSTRAALEHTDFGAIAEELFTSCKALTGAATGTLVELAEGFEKPVVGEHVSPRPGPSLDRVARALKTRAIRTQKVLYSNELEVRTWSQGVGSQRSVLVAPLTVDGTSAGLLVLADKPEGFSHNDASMVAAFAEIASLALTQSRARAQIHASLREKELLLKEIHHRVKNNLQLIASLLHLQASALEDPTIRTPLAASQARVRTMALIHDKLYGSKDVATIAFDEYLEELGSELVAGLERRDIDLELDLDDVRLGITEAIPLGLVANELLSNALAHAFPDNRPGCVTVGLHRRDGGEYELSVADNGVGLPQGVDVENAETLGLQIVAILAEQIGASLELTRDPGTRFAIIFKEAS
jgi:PAS domain S-box-containing protein